MKEEFNSQFNSIQLSTRSAKRRVSEPASSFCPSSLFSVGAPPLSVVGGGGIPQKNQHAPNLSSHHAIHLRYIVSRFIERLLTVQNITLTTSRNTKKYICIYNSIYFIFYCFFILTVLPSPPPIRTAAAFVWLTRRRWPVCSGRAGQRRCARAPTRALPSSKPWRMERYARSTVVFWFSQQFFFKCL